MNVYDLAGRLPGIPELRDRCRGLAMIEAIVCPQWEFRYYSFHAAWAPGEEMASMRNGSGDAYSIVFAPHGVFVRGLNHESPMSPFAAGGLWPGVVESVPEVFGPQVYEPAFSFNGRLDATFVLWRQSSGERWRTGSIEFPPYGGSRTSPDGAELLTILCDPSPGTYLAFAADYYETELDAAAVADVMALRPLDEETVAALNPDSRSTLRHDIEAMEYPGAPTLDRAGEG